MRNDKQTHKFRHKYDINGIIVIVIKVQGQNCNFVSLFSSFPAAGMRISLLSFIVLSGSLTSLSPRSSCSEGGGNERYSIAVVKQGGKDDDGEGCCCRRRRLR